VIEARPDGRVDVAVGAPAYVDVAARGRHVEIALSPAKTSVDDRAVSTAAGGAGIVTRESQAAPDRRKMSFHVAPLPLGLTVPRK
jgi:hypothetical protein